MTTKDEERRYWRARILIEALKAGITTAAKIAWELTGQR